MDPIHNIAVRHADAIAFRVDESDAQAGRIVGTAAHFGRPNSNGWTLAHGSLDDWLASFKRSGRKLPMLWSHLPNEQLGSFDDVRIEGDRLVLAGRLNLGVLRAKEVRALILAGDSTGLSVGAAVDHDHIKRTRNGAVFTKAELMETSIVAMPADDSARISVAASIDSRVDFERFLRSSGFARAAAAKLAAKGWAGLSKDHDQPKLAALIQRIAAATKEIEGNA